MWYHYLENTDALIFVVDSSDRERIDTCKEELDYLLNTEPLRNAAVLVYANKQDLPDAASAHELTKLLDMQKHTQHQWFVQSCIATRTDGLYEGLEWISQVITNKSK